MLDRYLSPWSFWFLNVSWSADFSKSLFSAWNLATTFQTTLRKKKGCSGEGAKVVLECPGKTLITNVMCNCLGGYTELRWDVLVVVVVVTRDLEPTLCFLLILNCVLKTSWGRQVCGNLVILMSFFSQQWKQEKLRERTVHWKNCPVLQQKSFLGISGPSEDKKQGLFLQWVRFLYEFPTIRERWEEGNYVCPCSFLLSLWRV